MRKHKSVTFQFEEPMPSIQFPHTNTTSTNCSLTAMNVEPPRLFSNMSPETKPVACKSRKYTADEMKYIRQETDRLLNEGVIEPSTSPWRAQVFVVPETETHRRRLVVDYSRTINMYTELDAYPLPRIDKIVNKISTYSIFSTLDLKSAYHQIPLREDEKVYTGFESCRKLYQFKRIPNGVTNGVSAFQRIIDDILEKENVEDTFAYIDNVTVCGNTQAEHDANLKRFLEVSEKYEITFNHNKKYFIQTKDISLGI